ncbi:MAG: hypothetical protein RLP44_20540 [Aggregatilineales bacterium]
MSEDDKRSTGEQPEIRRVGRNDRKRSLKAAQPIFPEQTAPASSDESADATPVPKIPIEVGDPSGMKDVKIPEISVAAVIAKTHNPKNITPPAERFPPLKVKKSREDVPVAPAIEAPAEPTGRKRRVGNWRHSLIAVVFIIATLGMCGYYSILWSNPQSSLNFFPPATPFIEVSVTPNPTQAAAFFATQTEAVRPTSTPSSTPTANIPTATASPENAALPFAVVGDVLYTPNTNDQACNWSSIAGTVTDTGGRALNNFGIQIVDVADPQALNERVFSGSALTFGDGGFELNLGTAPREAQYSVQLFSPAGVPVSDVFFVITSEDCEQNVAIISFVQVRPV